VIDPRFRGFSSSQPLSAPGIRVTMSPVLSVVEGDPGISIDAGHDSKRPDSCAGCSFRDVERELLDKDRIELEISTIKSFMVVGQ